MECATGRQLPVSTPGYWGVEAIWNHTNLWVNLQQGKQEGSGPSRMAETVLKPA